LREEYKWYLPTLYQQSAYLCSLSILKSALTNQAGKDLNLKWREACQFARRIEEAIMNKEIIVDHRKRTIRTNSGDEEIIL